VTSEVDHADEDGELVSIRYRVPGDASVVVARTQRQDDDGRHRGWPLNSDDGGTGT